MSGGASIPVVLLIVVGAVTAIIIAAIAQETRRREIRHREHMKAIEMGMTPPSEKGWAAAVCIAIGGVVPIAALTVGMIASLNPPRPRFEHGEVSVDPAVYFGCVWGAAIPIGVLGVIGGSLLGWLLLCRNRPSSLKPPSLKGTAHDTPYFEADAYDTVSTRS